MLEVFVSSGWFTATERELGSWHVYFYLFFFSYDATATNQWLWVTVSHFCVFQSVTLQLSVTLKRTRQVQKTKRLNIFFLFFSYVWMSAQALCSPSAVAPTSSAGWAEGHRALAPASGSCVASHMFSVIMSGCVILPAGCSSQRKKPCMKFYQLVNTSSVIIPQCIGALTWIDFFCILRILTASTVAAVDTDCTGVFYAVFLTMLVSTVTFLSPLNQSVQCGALFVWLAEACSLLCHGVLTAFSYVVLYRYNYHILWKNMNILWVTRDYIKKNTLTELLHIFYINLV